jgi:hypothetical protein
MFTLKYARYIREADARFFLILEKMLIHVVGYTLVLLIIHRRVGVSNINRVVRPRNVSLVFESLRRAPLLSTVARTPKMRSIVILACLLGSILAAPSDFQSVESNEIEQSGPWERMSRMLGSCITSDDITSCLGVKAAATLNRVSRMQKFEILPGVQFKRYNTEVTCNFNYVNWVNNGIVRSAGTA